MNTVIRLNGRGGELDKVVLSDDDATCEAIAQATIDLIASCMALAVGDTITITEE